MPRTLLFLLIPLLLLGSACQAPRRETVRARLAGEGEVALYLQTLPVAFADIRFELSACALLGQDGQSHPLPLALPVISAAEVGRQRLLAAGAVPAGVYQGITLTVSRAVFSAKSGEVEMLAPEAPIVVDLPLTLGRGEGRLVTLTLEVATTSPEAVVFTPRLLAAIPLLPPIGLVGYVSNEDDRTLTVYDKKAGEARALVALAERPAGVALDVIKQRLFVAFPERDALQVIDVRTNEHLERIPLNLGDQPQDLALVPGGEILLTVNRRSRTLSFVDTDSFLETARVAVGNRPGNLLVDPKGAFAFVVNEHDNTISVVDLARQRVAAVLATESSPVHITLSRDGGSLFVAHAWSPYLLVFDVTTLTRKRSVHVGMGVSTIKFDQRTERLYVARSNSEVVDIFDTSSYLPSSFIEADGGVTRMAIDNEENSLVLLLRKERRLQTINLVSRKPVLRIDVGAGPAWFAQAGER